MVTLRTFQNPAEAGLAKSTLEAANIRCELADENAGIYAIGVPIRLLVAEEQVDEARRVLDSDAEQTAADTPGAGGTPL